MLTSEKKKREQMHVLCIDDLVPEDHLLRKIENAIDWNFIYESAEDKYSKDKGRPSIDSTLKNIATRSKFLLLFQYFQSNFNLLWYNGVQAEVSK